MTQLLAKQEGSQGSAEDSQDSDFPEGDELVAILDNMFNGPSSTDDPAPALSDGAGLDAEKEAGGAHLSHHPVLHPHFNLVTWGPIECFFLTGRWRQTRAIMV